MGESADTIEENDLTDDPIAMQNFIEKFVEIKVHHGYKFTGYVQAIDPVSKSVILATTKDGNATTKILPGYAILALNIIKPDVDFAKPERTETLEPNQEELASRKHKLSSWLRHNLIPFEESNDSLQLGLVQIIPPYTSNDVCTDNISVATEIKRVIDRMPENFLS